MKEELLKQLSSSDATERRYAAEDLVELADEEVIQALVKALSDPVRAVCEAATEALIAIGSREVCHQTIALLYSEDVRVRNYAIEILEQVGDTDIEALMMLLKDESGDVRKFVSDVLGYLVEIGGEDAFLPLLKTLNDENVNVAAAAAEALGRLGNPKAISFLLRQLSREGWMQCNVIGAIAEIGGASAIGALNTIDPQHLTEEARFCLTLALRSAGTETLDGLA